MAFGDLAGEPQGVVEAAVDGDDVGAVGYRLRQLSFGDAPVGDDDVSLERAVSRVRRRRGAGVAGGGAEDGAITALQRLRHGHHHPAVLERPAGIAALQLEVEGFAADLLFEANGPNEGGIALAQGDRWGRFRDGQQVAVTTEHTLAPARRPQRDACVLPRPTRR